MRDVAAKLESPPALSALLRSEFSWENLRTSLDLPAGLPERIWESALTSPLCSMADRGGKELRSELVAICWELAGGANKAPVELCAIVEALHLGSLIVDDIEDDSSLRRGGPALHRAVGLPVALNAGNWLYFWPGSLIEGLGLPPATELALRRAVERAILESHYGQALDLTTRVTELRQRDVPVVVLTTTRLKTGSLMELSARLGALAAGAPERTVTSLGRLGRELGIALQMLDDLGGIGSSRRAAKGQEDLIAARSTWPWAWLAERADPVAYARLRTQGEAVRAGQLAAEPLAEALYHWVRVPGENAVRTGVERALAAAERELTVRSELGRLRAWLERLLRYNG